MAIANSVNAVAGGYQVLLATGDYAARTLTGTASQISITNGSGSTGNPVLSLPQNIDTAATVTFGVLTLTGAGLAPLNLVSTDAGATAGPIIDVYRNSASPAASDILGQLTFTGASSTAVKRIYSQISGNIVTATNASEDGSITLAVMSAGTLTTVGTVTNTGINSTAIGATNTSTGAFTTLASSTSLVASTASASNTLPLQGVCSAAGSSTGGPTADLFRNGASANGNISGQLLFSILSSTSAKAYHAGISSSILSNTNGAISGSLQIFTLQGGTQKNVINTTANGGQYQGNNTNTASPAGYIGEILSTVVASGSGVTLTDGVGASVATLTLTAGNWQLSGFVGFFNNAVTTYVIGTISSVAASVAGRVGGYFQIGTNTAVYDAIFSVPNVQVSISGSTSYYLVAQAGITSGTCKAFGTIQAVRIG